MPESDSTRIHFLNPTPEFYFAKGTKAFEQSDLPAAIKYLTRAAGLAPKNTLIICQLAICYTENGECEKSNELLSDALKIEYKPYFYYFMANNYAYLANFKQAIYYSRRYLQEKPRGEYAGPARELVAVLEERFEAEQQDEAVKPLVRESTPLERQQQAVVDQVESYVKEGYVDKAVRYLETAMLIETLPIYALELSVLYYRNNRKSEAEALIAGVETAYEGHYLARCHRAISAYYSGDWQLFQSYVTQLEAIYPFTSHEQLQYAIVKTLAKDYEGALAIFTKLNENIGAHRKFYFYASKAAFYSGNQALADYYWQQFGNYDTTEPYANIWREMNDDNIIEADAQLMFSLLNSTEQADRLMALMLVHLTKNKVEALLFSYHFTPGFFTEMEKGFYADASIITNSKQTLAYKNGGFTKQVALALSAEGCKVTRETIDVYKLLFRFTTEQTEKGIICQEEDQEALVAALLHENQQKMADKLTKRTLIKRFGVTQGQLNKYIKKIQAYK